MGCSNCGKKSSSSKSFVRPTAMVSAAKGPGHFTFNHGVKKVIGRTPFPAVTPTKSPSKKTGL